MEDMERRSAIQQAKFEIRESGEDLYIEGYFAVFNSVYEMFPGYTEEVDPHAFDETLDGDIRALINHDSGLVIGRTKAGTLELRVDDHGLWGRVKVNPNDQDAVNLYERVKRGDVDQCSFGFRIDEQNVVWGEDDSVHVTLMKVTLWEVSVVTFPAYEDTSVEARKRDFEEIKAKRIEQLREGLRKKLKGEAYGTESTDASQASE